MEQHQVFGLSLLIATFILGTCILFLPDSVTLRMMNLPPIGQYVDPNATRKIVFWTSFFGVSKWGIERIGGDNCNVTCDLSWNRSDPLEYDALVFHGRDSQNPPKKRKSRQVYVMMLHESPYHRGNSFVTGGDFYNWTMTYSRMSDIFHPYFLYDEMNETEKNVSKDLLVKSTLPQMKQTRKGTKEARILWVVSNCWTPGKRRAYVDKLKEYLLVDIYGGCGQKCPSKNCHEDLAKTGRYKFYLSFENSVCRDYITEKVYRALSVNLLPIVYGGLSTQDYINNLPPQSFIDVRNYRSPKHLAEYLKYLDKNDTAYLEYFSWKKTHKSVESGGWCELCRALYDTTRTRKNVDFGKFWSESSNCDNKFIDTVI